MKQMKEIKDFIDRMVKKERKKGEMIVFTGDLNANHKQPLIDPKKVQFIDNECMDKIATGFHKESETQRYNLYETLVNILGNKSAKSPDKIADYRVINVHEAYCR